MTRQQAHEKMGFIRSSQQRRAAYHELIDEIFDFFENKQSKYEPIHKSSIDTFKRVDEVIKRCKSCKWFDHDRGVCDHCAFGYPYVDQNGKTPSQVGNCTIYTPKE